MCWKNIVIEGGGSKGIACLGALDYLYIHKPKSIANVQCYAGSSAGSLIALFLVLGYTPHQILDIITSNKSRNMRSHWFWYPTNVLSLFGLNTRSRFIKYILPFLKEKNLDQHTTFKQLFESTHKTLVITGTNVSKRRVDYFSHLTFPNMPVLSAIEASINIPFYFTKFSYNGDYYIDGGVLVNFPLYYFDDFDTTGTLCPNSKQLGSIKSIKPNSKESTESNSKESTESNIHSTLGIKTIDVDYDYHGLYIGNTTIKSLYDYTSCTIHTLFQGIERLYISKNYWERTIAIHLNVEINLTEFSLPLDVQNGLWQLGLQAAEKYCIQMGI